MDTDGAEYSDFEVQSFEFSTKVDTNSGGSGRATVVNGFEPLSRTGGLDNNEIAELVHLEVQCSPEIESFPGEVIYLETRGAVGINLDRKTDLLLTGVPEEESDTTQELLNQGDGSNGATNTTTLIGSERLMEVRGILQEGGLHVDRVKHDLRSMYGRGPALDTNDELTCVNRIIVENGGSGNQYNATFTGRAVWDVAEVSDAGRNFSIQGAIAHSR